MSAIAAQALRKQLKWRYATKQFDPAKKIDSETWAALEEALVLSPSSFGLQPWRFYVITSQQTKEKLFPLSCGQRQLVDASHVVVFAVKDPITSADIRRHVERTAQVRGIPAEALSDYEKIANDFLANATSLMDVRSWSSRQVYIALGNFMTCAALLGVDTCPIEGLDPTGYDKELGLEGSGFWTVAACPAGYRAHHDKYASALKVRFPKEEILTYLP
ncbi:MAG TPA: NAD(P)H-dependent oxidoreductase [Terrimicrobiaceae bacterium]